MSRFIETIKVSDGRYKLPDMHLQRIQDTCMQYYGRYRKTGDILAALNTVYNKKEIYKLTIRYDLNSFTTEVIPYRKRLINHLVLIENNEIDYRLKYADRSALEKCKNKSGINNECIIVKHGHITDTSFSNLIFWNGNEWHTPGSPLLPGIKRKFLLEKKMIFEKDILLSNLSDYSKVSLINAMLEPGDSVLDVDRIVFLSDL